MNDAAPHSSAGTRLDEAVEAARPSGRLERVFGTRGFFRLWIAQVVSATGDWLGLFATIALADKLAPGGAEGNALPPVLLPPGAPGFFL
ncbi:MAG: hypothetical protein OXC00_03780, partial [Acidimicrobiaceae bacterium]|nr:hypothetical protein [Acidimicrobiaceae bacterium]